jgi:Sec-independent protein secretion pathway component TatC
MSSNSSSSLLVQAAFNLLVLILIIIALVSVVGDLLSPRPDFSKDIILVLVLIALFVMGVGLLVRLIRTSLREEP